MTDDDLTPEQQEVRRLLADVRHDEPMPDPVVARLERVLEVLAEEPVRVAPVTELATRRRRAASLLLAAAAVVAIGVGVSQVVDTGTGSAESLSSADRDEAGDAEQDTAARDVTEPEQPTDEDDGGAQAPTESQVDERAVPYADLSRDAYSEDVSALREDAASLGLLSGLSAYSAAGATCLSDDWGEGTFVPVRYAGIPAVLVFRRALGDTQVADLFLCGDSEPHRSVTLPAP